MCATHGNPKPAASDCVRAYDETHTGKVDLSKKVRVGEPVQKSHLHWAVPYDVVDAAGNAAQTVWRDVIVDEVDLHQVETKFRREALHDRDAEIEAAVKKALLKREKHHLADVQVQVRKAVEEDRAKRQVPVSTPGTCPACPKCSSGSSDTFDERRCDAICKARMESCAIREESWVVQTMLWMEEYFPLPLIPYALFVALVLFGWMALRFVVAVVFAPSVVPNYRTYVASEERERAMQSSVTVYQSPGTGTLNSSNGMAQPSLFSPQPAQQPQRQQTTASPSVYASPASAAYEDIYASPEVITPRRRRRGDYASPFTPR